MGEKCNGPNGVHAKKADWLKGDVGLGGQGGMRERYNGAHTKKGDGL